MKYEEIKEKIEKLRESVNKSHLYNCEHISIADYWFIDTIKRIAK